MRTTGQYKINGSPVLAPTALQYGYTRQAKTADRSDSGVYDDDRIADGLDVNVTFRPKSWEECSYIMTLLSKGQYIDFTYRSTKSGSYITQVFYVGDRSVDVLNDVEDANFATFNITAHLVCKNSDSEGY